MRIQMYGFLVAASILLSGSQAPVAAQMPIGIASHQTIPVVVAPSQDKFLMLVQPRDITEIERDIQLAEQMEESARESERVGESQKSLAASRIDEQKRAISENKDRMKSAQRTKNDAEVLLLKNEEKALERSKKLHEERESLLGAEIDLAKKRLELASLMKQAFELERQLAIKRWEQTETSVSGPESARSATVVIQMERASLEMQKKVAEKQGEVAGKAKTVVEKQLKTLEAQQKVYAGQ